MHKKKTTMKVTQRDTNRNFEGGDAILVVAHHTMFESRSDHFLILKNINVLSRRSVLKKLRTITKLGLFYKHIITCTLCTQEKVDLTRTDWVSFSSTRWFYCVSSLGCFLFVFK